MPSFSMMRFRKSLLVSNDSTGEDESYSADEVVRLKRRSNLIGMRRGSFIVVALIN